MSTKSDEDKQHLTKLRPRGWKHGDKLDFKRFTESVFTITRSPPKNAAAPLVEKQTDLLLAGKFEGLVLSGKNAGRDHEDD